MKFVSKELALKLKEKGFDKPCFGGYNIVTPTGHIDGELVLNKTETRGCVYKDCLESYNLLNKQFFYDNIVDAPTIDQVLEWLRDEKNIFIWMKPYHTYATKNNICWDWNISIVNNTHELSKYCSDEGFAKHEDACIAGIEYVINNLI